MTFVDSGRLEIEDYPVVIGGEERHLCIVARYDVECSVQRHSHSCLLGEDYPDGAECQCIYLELEECQPYNENGEPEEGFSIGDDDLKAILLDLKDRAAEDYCQHGAWRQA